MTGPVVQFVWPSSRAIERDEWGAYTSASHLAMAVPVSRLFRGLVATTLAGYAFDTVVAIASAQKSYWLAGQRGFWTI
jgi:hypothetical protein